MKLPTTDTRFRGERIKTVFSWQKSVGRKTHVKKNKTLRFKTDNCKLIADR